MNYNCVIIFEFSKVEINKHAEIEMSNLSLKCENRNQIQSEFKLGSGFELIERFDCLLLQHACGNKGTFM